MMIGHCENCKGTNTETTNNPFAKGLNTVNKTIHAL